MLNYTVPSTCSVCEGELRVPAAQYYQVGALSSWRHRYADDCRAVLDRKERAAQAALEPAVKPREIW